MANKWPRDTESAKTAFYGPPASTSGFVRIHPPYKMYYGKERVDDDGPLVDHKVADSLMRVFNKVWDYYGHDQKKIDALGISKTAGIYNPRKISGSASWSNHAWGIAIDINAEENGFHTAGNIPIPMIAAFKSEGWRWGGNYKGRKDPMHFEAVESGETVRSFDEWLRVLGAKPGEAGKPAEMPPPVYVIKTVPWEDKIIPWLMEDEGGYGNDPNDAGGPTNFGITLSDYRKYIKVDGTAQDVSRMSKADAIKIYKSEAYWGAPNMALDAMPAGLDYALFDWGVHSGIHRPIPYLQRIVQVNDDDEVGNITLTAVRSRDVKQLIDLLCDARAAYLKGRPDFKHFPGWLPRVERVRVRAKSLVDANPAPTVGPKPPPTPAPKTPQPAIPLPRAEVDANPIVRWWNRWFG